jgi:hypothetical protein
MEAHALLLCSLLLGFGLDAYVAVGTLLASPKKTSVSSNKVDAKDASGGTVEMEHIWVMTFSAMNSASPSSGRRVTCWDPCVGTSEPFQAFASRMKLSSLPQLFNHNQLLAALNPSLQRLSLNIEDRSVWYAFDMPQSRSGGHAASSLSRTLTNHQSDLELEIGRVNHGFALYHPSSPSALSIAKTEENIEAYLRYEV